MLFITGSCMVEKEDLVKLYKEINIDIRDFSDREWETVKFFTTIFTALLAAYITITAYLISSALIERIWMISIIIPPFMIIISVMGWRNFKRECARLFERIATKAKIEEKIGFHHVRDKNRIILKCDEYYLPKSFVKGFDKFDKTKEFVDDMLKRSSVDRHGNSYSIFKWIFILYVLMSVLIPVGLIALTHYFF